MPRFLQRPRAVCVTAAVTVLAALSSPLTAAPSRVELDAARDRLLEIERDFELVAEEHNLVSEDLERIHHEMASTQLVVRDIERRMALKREAAVSLAVELYKAGPASAVGAVVVLSSDSLAEVDTRIAYLARSNEAQARVFERLAADDVELEHHLATLEDAKARALAKEERLADLRADIEAKLKSQRDEIAELNAAIERAAARAAARAEAARAAAVAAGIFASSGVEPDPAPAPNRRAQAAVDAALSQIGKPYVWGASGPDSYDCSGLTMWAWARAGVALPHNSGAQYEATVRVPRSDWEPGDLLFFGAPIHHVAMYIGNGQMVEAPYSGNRVRVVPADRSDYVGAGRPGV